MTREELLAAIEDAEGESMSCGDDECWCHRVPGRLRDELEWMDGQP